MLLAAIAAALAAAGRRRGETIILLAVILLPALGFCLFGVQERRLLAGLGPALVLAGGALDGGLRLLRARRARRAEEGAAAGEPPGAWVAAAGLAAALGLALLHALSKTPSPLLALARAAPSPHPLREAGAWLKNQPGAGGRTVVMAREPQAAFYAGARFVRLPFAGAGLAALYARNQGVAYAVIWEPSLRRLRPQLVGLLDERRPPPGWEPVWVLEWGPGNKVIIYRPPGGPRF